MQSSGRTRYRRRRPAPQEDVPRVHKILIIDDDTQVARVMQRLLHRRGFPVVEVASSGEEGLEMLTHFAADLVISDYLMPGIRGHQVLEEIRTAAPNALRVLMSAYVTPRTLIERRDAAPDLFHFFFSKPWDDEKLLANLRTLLEQRSPPSP